MQARYTSGWLGSSSRWRRAGCWWREHGRLNIGRGQRQANADGRSKSFKVIRHRFPPGQQRGRRQGVGLQCSPKRLAHHDVSQRAHVLEPHGLVDGRAKQPQPVVNVPRVHRPHRHPNTHVNKRCRVGRQVSEEDGHHGGDVVLNVGAPFQIGHQDEGVPDQFVDVDVRIKPPVRVGGTTNKQQRTKNKQTKKKSKPIVTWEN